MKDFAPAPRTFEVLSRELWLVVDAQWNVLWLDDRARRVLGMSPGSRLRDRAAPGSEDKLDRLALEAAAGNTEAWEVVLLVEGNRASSRSAHR